MKSKLFSTYFLAYTMSAIYLGLEEPYLSELSAICMAHKGGTMDCWRREAVFRIILREIPEIRDSVSYDVFVLFRR